MERLVDGIDVRPHAHDVVDTSWELWKMVEAVLSECWQELILQRVEPVLPTEEDLYIVPLVLASDGTYNEVEDDGEGMGRGLGLVEILEGAIDDAVVEEDNKRLRHLHHILLCPDEFLH